MKIPLHVLLYHSSLVEILGIVWFPVSALQ
jgi:hypothetical protein